MSTPQPSGRTRPPLQGVRRILHYNLPFYAMALTGSGAVVLLLLAAPWPAWVAVPAIAFVILTLLWSLTSLAASYWVYDRSPLYRFAWLTAGLERAPRRWLNLHNGLDEVGSAVEVFPDASRHDLDVYDPAAMTEPAIRRARSTDRSPAPVAAFNALPVSEASCDLVTIIFTGHELRSAADRRDFLREVARALTPNGTLVLVEHLRDLPNALVFGPGVLHFLPLRTWTAAFVSTQLVIERDVRITPFVHALFLRLPSEKTAPSPDVRRPA